eukprot:TRINITY_DN1466_c0_g1_i2.p1 TRINITY_DN1466_c0_g1~~TRINITY_DN1466_c0_g1_i2.p1  ORF type:complete len:139 (-),score=14.01 TRINITY_DN1466_c0_g1_i2:107-523(-)
MITISCFPPSTPIDASVTVGFDNTTADNLSYWAPECGSEYLPTTPLTFAVSTVAMAMTGNYGTVSLPARVAVYPYPESTGYRYSDQQWRYHAGDSIDSSTRTQQHPGDGTVVQGAREGEHDHPVKTSGRLRRQARARK